VTGSSDSPAGAGPSAVERAVAGTTGASAEDDPQGTPPAERTANSALVGCLWLAGGALVLALFYFGFFAFAVADDWFGWGLLEPDLDDRTSEILYVVYWPLIHLYMWLGQ
jgi:hypothetical protein